MVQDCWKFHTAKVLCLAWSPSGRHLASGSLDTNIIIWSVETPEVRIIIRAAHPQAAINKVGWVAEGRLLSAGADTSLRSWSFPALEVGFSPLEYNFVYFSLSLSIYNCDVENTALPTLSSA